MTAKNTANSPALSQNHATKYPNGVFHSNGHLRQGNIGKNEDRNLVTLAPAIQFRIIFSTNSVGGYK